MSKHYRLAQAAYYYRKANKAAARGDIDNARRARAAARELLYG